MNRWSIERVQELRRRLTGPVLILLVGIALGYFWQRSTLEWLQGPMHGNLFMSQIAGDVEFLWHAYLLEVVWLVVLVLLMLYIDRTRPLPLASLRRWRTRVVIGSFAAALILRIGPDPIAQITLAMPVILAYVVLLRLLARTRRPVPAAQAAPSVQPRLPMAIAVPNQRPRRSVPLPATPPPRPPKRGIIDLREH